MKITITPETDVDRLAVSETREVKGLVSLAIVGVSYDADVLRVPYHFSCGDLLDVMREFAPATFEMSCEVAAKRGSHTHGEPQHPPRHVGRMDRIDETNAGS